MPHGPKGNGQAWRVLGTPSRVGPPSRNPDGQRRPSRCKLVRAMPQSIKLIDAEGRSCIYVPITQDGKVVDSQGYALELDDE
jgi:hypothetical protein